MKLKLLLIALILFAIWMVFFGAKINNLHPKPSVPPVETTNNTLIPPQFLDKSIFLSPIKQVNQAASPNTLSGITVPHHLLATDLIAKAFSFASAGKYDQILLISPDHYNLGKTNISIASKDFSTVFGTIKTDGEAVKNLKQLSVISEEDFFYREHGLGAELPFIKYYFLDAKIIALTFKETTPKAELLQIVDLLEKTLNKNSLIVQSTDFSHYLTLENASTRDTQTTKVLEARDADALFNLNQPDNLDSIAAQYVQMRLQNEFYNSKLQILDHKNSQDYTKEKVDSTTSYIVQAYTK